MIKFKSIFLIFSFVAIFCKGQHYGEPGHPMNRSTDNRDILNYWKSGNEGLSVVYDRAYQILSGSKTATFEDVVADKNIQRLLRKYKIDRLGGPMLGNIRSDGVSIWLRPLQAATVEVEVYNDEFRKKYGPVYTGKDSDFMCTVDITGLGPQTGYSYRVLIDDKAIELPFKPRFMTAPEGEDTEVKVAFGSCPHRWGLGNQKLFDRIHSRGNLALLLLGDIAVQDRNDHLGLHRADYLLRDFLPAWQGFSARIPVYASWDDHDYFDNDKSGIPGGYTQKDKEGVRNVFRNSWANPSYGSEENGKGIFTRSRIGPFDIIMTDNRFFRTGEKGSFLGDEQMKWLKEQLLDCKGPFIILSCGSMWSDYVSKGKDSWGVNDPDGREEIFKFIEQNNISGVLLISGDRHGARGFTIPRDSGFEFYEFEAASLGARVGPPATDPSWDTQLYGIDGQFAFGEFTYIPSDDDPEVVFRLVGEDGNYLYECTLRKSQLTPRKKNLE
jgi:alkaline phosphatase D